jgi:hypothetical protein
LIKWMKMSHLPTSQGYCEDKNKDQVT